MNQAISRCFHMSGTADQPNHGFGNVTPSVVMLQNHIFVPLLVLWPVFAQCSAQTHELRSIPFFSDGFVRFQQLIINNISVFEAFWPSFTRTIVNIEITDFEATESITARCFTYSSISVNFWELSMRFSRRFLRVKEENQHFPQMTIISHKIRHFHTAKSI